MKYQVRGKLFSFTDDFTIKNEYNEDHAFILSLIIVLDKVIDDQQNSN